MSSEVINTSTNFNDLGLAEPILRAINDAGYTTPTPIQAKAIPQVLSGGDLLAGAQTGTGKTAGFTLPILHMLLAKPIEVRKAGRPRVLILTPHANSPRRSKNQSKPTAATQKSRRW